jgi:hypothetical protein
MVRSLIFRLLEHAVMCNRTYSGRIEPRRYDEHGEYIKPKRQVKRSLQFELSAALLRVNFEKNPWGVCAFGVHHEPEVVSKQCFSRTTSTEKHLSDSLTTEDIGMMFFIGKRGAKRSTWTILVPRHKLQASVPRSQLHT